MNIIPNLWCICNRKLNSFILHKLIFFGILYFMENKFLPVSKTAMNERGIKTLDFILVVGDAYVDHPSFGHAIISRVLENEGYSVVIIAQPDWRDKTDFMQLGRPRLAMLVAS